MHRKYRFYPFARVRCFVSAPSFTVMEFDPFIEIMESETVYPVSDDSILLIRSLNITQGERVLEIGCGSGVVSIHCAKNGCIVTAADINPDAVKTARLNADLNFVPMDVVYSDVYENVNGIFDTIVFNLPYLPVEEEGMAEKAWSGGADGLGPLPRLLRDSKKHLTKDGRIVIVVSSLMDQKRLNDVLSKYDVTVLGEEPMFFEKLSVLEIRRSS